MRALGDEVAVSRIVHRQQRLAAFDDGGAEALYSAARRGVSHEDSPGEVSGEHITNRRMLSSGPVDVPGNRRENEHAAIGDGLAPFAGDTHADKAASGAEDDGLLSAQEGTQALALDAGMEAADHGNTQVA